MKKKYRAYKRKMRPEPPRWFTLDTDTCWFCEHRKACSGCKLLKELEAYKNAQRKRKEKNCFKKSLIDKINKKWYNIYTNKRKVI